MTAITSSGGTGIKPQRSTSANPTQAVDVDDPFMELNASFSYGSSDEEDGSTSPKVDSSAKMVSNLNSASLSSQSVGIHEKNSVGRMGSKNSGKMFARRKTKIPAAFNSSSSGSSRFLPLSQREKMKRATKLMQQRHEKQDKPVSPNLSLADLVKRSDADGKNLYRDSWRNRKKDKNDTGESETENMPEAVKDDEAIHHESSRSLFECILSAIVSGGGCGDSSTEGSTLNSSTGRSVQTYNFFDDDHSFASTDISGKESSNASTTSDGFESDSINDRYSVPQSQNDKSKKMSVPVTLDSCIDAMMAEKWDDLLRLIKADPSVLAKTSSLHRRKTLLHILCGQDADIPVTILVNMINFCPASVSQTDQDGCIPLHHMVFTGGKDKFVKILLESWSFGAKVRNVDGDLPLHVSVWAGQGNENIAEMLMDAYPQAVGQTNNALGTPLHLACCETNASPAIVESIIQMQVTMDVSFNIFDKNGNTPLHVAIKTKAPLEVIKVIYSELGSEPFCQADKNNVYPLQMAMSMKNIDPAVVKFICTSAPRIMKKQMTNGMMPVRMAAEQGLPQDIVKELLLADSPIKFMPLMPQLREVVLRIHSHSWWHVISSEGRYAPVVGEILSEMASIHEIVSLCQEPDLNGYSSMYERAHRDVKNVLNKSLVFCDRYKIAPEYKATIIGGLLLLCAIDINGDLTVQRNARTVGNIPAVSSPQQHREVLLHCCVKGSKEYNELVDEINAREKFNFSHLHSQQLFKVHSLSAAKIGCSGDMLCLAFERPLLTLQEIFETSRFRKRKNQQWARKSLNLLLSLARVLKYFHNIGYVHGYVEPSTIGKFIGSNNWKMLDMRRATEIGKPMRGDLRYGAPPESVTISKVQGVAGEVKKMVSFDENFVRVDLTSEKDDENEISESLEFCPQECIASTSWDIWSFGLIMGQLVLGQSMVLLPNIEKASDAHLKNLHNYDDASAKKIYDAAHRVSGKAAAVLLSKLLQPRPEDRPQSMDEVLSFDYFKVAE